MSNAKQDVELLMNEWVVFGKNMLAEHGEFFPYGAAMKPDGEIVSLAVDTGDERPPSQEIIDVLIRIFQDGAQEGQYKATALFYDVRIPIQDSDDKTDAIAVALDHVDNYSVTVFFPYRIENSEPIFDALSAAHGTNNIFL